MIRRSLTLGLLVTLPCVCADASPQTILTFDRFVAGSEVGSRFGSEIACRGYNVSRALDSVFVVGAPNASAGEGRVYVYNPLNPGVPKQVIEPPPGIATRKFGVAIEFIDDINGDDLEDLLIGASGDVLTPVGQVFAFTSTYTEGDIRYSSCGAVSGPLGFGDTLQSLQDDSADVAARVVVGNPRYGRIDGVSVALQQGGACVFSLNEEFSGSQGEASQFGSSLGQVDSLRPDGTLSSALLVAAPGEGQVGVVHRFEAGMPIGSVEAPGATAEPYRRGSLVSARANSDFYVVGSPRDDDSRGSVALYRSSESADLPYCSISNPIDERSENFGSSVHLLGGAFRGLAPNTDEVFAFRRAEDETGGALALIGVSALSCSALLPVNNCQRDPGQEQASEIAGGVDCGVFLHGRLQWMLLSGSPGWQGGRGRVDVAFEEGIGSAPSACLDGDGDLIAMTEPAGPIDDGIVDVSPTATPIVPDTPTILPSVTVSPTATGTFEPLTPTPIPTALETVGETAIPTAGPVGSVPVEVSMTPSSTPTPMNTATTSPTISATPTSISADTPTSIPTATATSISTAVTSGSSSSSSSNSSSSSSVSLPTQSAPSFATPAHQETISPVPTRQDTGETQNVGGVNQNSPDPQVTTDKPIVVGPGTTGLPAPAVIIAGDSVEVRMPDVSPQLSTAQRAKAIRDLQKKRRLSKNRAAEILYDPDNLVVTYIVYYLEVATSRRFALIQNAYADGPGQRASKVRQIRGRRNNVTLRNVRPGASYRVYYTIEISLKKPRSVIGVSKPSAASTFTAL